MPVATPGDRATAERTITGDRIDAYAELVGDDNPMHCDPAYAEEGLFGGIVAHGMYGAGIISAALADLPGDIVYVSQDLEFVAPVRPGDTVTATVEVLETLPEDRLRVETTARTDEPVITGEAEVLSVEH